MAASGPDPDAGLDGAVSMWDRYSPREWALRWLQGQRELMQGAARDRDHASAWLEKEAVKAVANARRLMSAPQLAERQVVLAEIIRREVLPAFDAWFEGEWEPESNRP